MTRPSVPVVETPKINPFTSKTVLGAVLWAVGFLLQPEVLAALPEKWSALLQALGGVLTAFGIRSAIGKAAVGRVQLHPLAMVIAVSAAFGTLVLPKTLPSPFPLTLAVDEWYGNVAGDSLKYVITWKQPADSATLGKIDSTFYRFVSNKGVTFFGSSGLTTPGTGLRRTVKGLGDSLKLVKPAVGDSATFQITNFQECRKGDCSVPGSAAWKYRRSYAPPPASPDVQITEF